jgi:hypothetical protein
MDVRGVGNAGAMGKAQGHGRPSEAAQQVPQVEQPADGAEAPDTAVQQAEAKGVLRLLLARHFRGVADVRLRINFAERLPDDMPALSTPKGNGAAYAKFLAAYNDLFAPASPAGEATTEPGEGLPPAEPEAESAA